MDAWLIIGLYPAGLGKQLHVVQLDHDASLMGANETLKVHIMRPKESVRKELYLIVSAGETECLVKSSKPIQERTASQPSSNVG